MMIIEGEAVEYLTIREYAKRFDLPEPTVRSRIRMNKLKTERREVDGRIVHTIVVPIGHRPSTSVNDEPIITDDYDSSPEITNDNDSSSSILRDIIELWRTEVEVSKNAIREAAEAQAQVRLLTDNQRATEQTMEQLRQAVFEKESRIKELEAKLSRPWWKIW